MVISPTQKLVGGSVVRPIVLFVMAFILTVGGMATFVSGELHKNNAQALDVTKYAMCDLFGKDAIPAKVYQATQTSDIPFMVRSKSTMNIGTDRVDGGLNSVLDLTGYDRAKINSTVLGRNLTGTPEYTGESKDSAGDKDKKNYNGGEKISVFDRFGVAGMKFTSYTGEWKYLIVDACGADNAPPQDPKAGAYYDGRLEPQSTWEDINNSKDVRTKQFARGFGAQYLSSVANTIANWIFTATKAIVVFVLALVGLSFSDLPKALGISNLIIGNNAGGGGGSSGLFGTLFKEIFVPLSVLAVFAFGVAMIFYMIRRQYRLGLSGVIRVVAVFIGAFFLAANPALLISLPNTIAITAQALAAESLNKSLVGDDGLCSTDIGKNTSKDLTAGAGDAKNDSSVFMEKTAKNVQSSMGCMFWQTFLLKPWAQGQFGTDWNHLWEKGQVPSWASQYSETGEVDNANKSWVGEPIVPLGGGQEVKNWALFQLSTQTNAHSPVGHKGEVPKYSNGISNDWWRIVDALSNYDEKKNQGTIGGGSSSSSADSDADSTGSSTWVNPAKGPMVSGYGPRNLSIDAANFHYGADVAAPCDADIHAASEGVVKFAGKEAGGGNMILITHAKDKVDTAYVHMKEGSNVVKAGDHVKAGQVISKVGMTGTASACHLHFEVRDPGDGNWASFSKTVDPVAFLKKKGINLGEDGTGQGGNSSSSSTSSSSDSGHDAHIPLDPPNPTSPYWGDWNGNAAWNRMGTALSSVFIAGIGLLPAGVFSTFAAIYAIITPLIVAILPIMMLFSLGSQRMFDIFLKYIKTLGYYTVLRIIYGVLMLLSIVFTNVALGYLSSVGWWLSIALLIIFALVLWKLRGMLIKALTGSRAFGSQFNQDVSNLTGKFTGVFRAGAGVATQSAVGGVAAKRNGGSFAKGSLAAGRNELRNSFYRSGNNEGFGRSFSISMEKFKTESGGNLKDSYGIANRTCGTCGKRLEGGIFGRDSRGNYYCQECKDDGLTPAGTREVLVDVDEGRQRHKDRGDDFARAEASKMATASGKRNQARLESLKSEEKYDKEGNVVKDEKGQPLKLSKEEIDDEIRQLVKTTSVDIVRAQVRDDRGFSNINVKVPQEIEPYLDRQNVAEAWKDGNYDYIEIAYISAWSQWYKEATNKQVDIPLNELIDDVHHFTEHIEKRRIEKQIFD